MRRIVSLLPSATEMVCALGARERLVGVSHECDFPPEVVGLPILTTSKVSSSGTSAQIDAEIRVSMTNALAVYDVDDSLLAEVRPDLIVTQDLCEVCAVSFSDVERAVAKLAGEACRIVSLPPTRLDDVFEDLRRVGVAIGAEERAEACIAGYRDRIAAIARRAARAPERPTVLTIEWLEPIMIGATWMPELVAYAGGEALVTRPGDHAPTLDEAALAQLAPDVVVVKPCGFDLARTRQEVAPLRALMQRLDWPAWRQGRVWLADGNAFFNRPGPRLVESLEILAACMHPELFADLGAAHAGDFESLTRA